MRNLLIALALIASISLTACSGPSWGQYSTPTVVYPTTTPYATATLIPTPAPATPTPTLEPATETPIPSPTPIPTQVGTPNPPILYYSQSGDWLPAVAVRFGVSLDTITSPDPLPAQGLLNPGTLLIIPDVLGETTPVVLSLPDSEFIYSPTALDFNTLSFVAERGGYLDGYNEYLKTTSNTSGAEIIQMLADQNSINPRLLLALLEYESGWVRGQPANLSRTDYPFGYRDFNERGLFAQAVNAVEDLSVGYYDYRAGKLTDLTFPDGQTIRISPGLNAGSAALQYYFSLHYNYDDWAKAIDPNIGLPALYTEMFGDPWQRATAVEPLMPPQLVQPKLSLPFLPGLTWSYTGGPHAAWESRGALAAVDFAPPSDQTGCDVSPQWVVAPAPGLVTRSENGVVMLDLDGDGSEQTGWVLLFLHMASDGRVKAGTWLNQNDRIGHPSCEGGISTGKHVHLARKFNGEWILADGPMPFDLDGWVVQNGNRPYMGTLTKGDKIVKSSVYGDYKSHIKREPEE